MKLAIALLLAAVTPAAIPGPSVTMPLPEPTTNATPYFIPLNLVEKIECGNFIGSGARIDAHTVITARHVVSTGHCTINGKRAKIVANGEGQDFSVMRTTDTKDSRMTISCEGVVEGREYFAIGWAFGDDLVVQRATGTKSRVLFGMFSGLSMLRANTYPGMSGGPIVDDRGNIVGIVNAGPRNGVSFTLSRSLADTYLCAKKAR